MSHDGIWRAACLNRNWIRILHLDVLSVARGVTDVGVGSGALLARVSHRSRKPRAVRVHIATKSGCDEGISPIEVRFINLQLQLSEITSRQLENGEANSFECFRARTLVHRQTLTTTIFE
jgi:hypothetical protein